MRRQVQLEIKRSIWATAIIYALIVIYSLPSLHLIVAGAALLGIIRDQSDYRVISLGIGSLVSVFCLVAVLRYNKWGFWGFCVATFLMPLPIALHSLMNSLVQLPPKANYFIFFGAAFGAYILLYFAFPVGLLYLALYIGKERNVWRQLE